jgi:hypothetical protein
MLEGNSVGHGLPQHSFVTNLLGSMQIADQARDDLGGLFGARRCREGILDLDDGD